MGDIQTVSPAQAEIDVLGDLWALSDGESTV
jgi:hypothetical protein